MRKFNVKAVGLIVALALFAGACGSDDDTASDGGTSSTAAAGGSSNTTEPGSDGSCDPADPVKVGASLSLTGPSKDVADRSTEGATMAIEELNADGGVLGRCLELIIKDDGAEPTKASQVARELVDQEEVDFIIGPFASSPLGVSIEVTNPAKVLQATIAVLPAAGDATAYPYVFRAEVSATQQGPSVVAEMERRGLKHAGILALNTALGTTFHDAMLEAVEGTDIEVSIEYFDSGAVDVTSQITKLQSAGADVLLAVVSGGGDNVTVVNARNQIGWDVPILGFSNIASEAVIDGIGADGMDNVLAGQTYRYLAIDPETDEIIGEKARDWYERLKEFYGGQVTHNITITASMYDAVMMIAEAMNATGTTDPDEVRTYLEENGHEGVKADYVFTAESHDGVPLDALVFTEAASLNGGLLRLPSQ